MDLVKELDKEITDIDSTRIDFEEFLKIMVAKMVQKTIGNFHKAFQDHKDTPTDIEKAYKLFVDPSKDAITFQSLKKIVEELSKK